jgi:hypothetical protein
MQATRAQAEPHSLTPHLGYPDRKAQLDRLETLDPMDHQEMPDRMQQEG